MRMQQIDFVDFQVEINLFKYILKQFFANEEIGSTEYFPWIKHRNFKIKIMTYPKTIKNLQPDQSKKPVDGERDYKDSIEN